MVRLIIYLKKRHLIQIYSRIINEKGRNIAKNIRNALHKYFDFLIDVYEADLNTSILNVKIPEYVIQNTSTIDSNKTLELIELMKKKKGFANQRNILMFLILATTGIRRKEVVGIKLDDIDFENNTIYIANPKCNKKPRYVLLAEIVKNYLKDYLIERNKRKLTPLIEIFSLDSALLLEFLFSNSKAKYYSDSLFSKNFLISLPE